MSVLVTCGSGPILVWGVGFRVKGSWRRIWKLLSWGYTGFRLGFGVSRSAFRA